MKQPVQLEDVMEFILRNRASNLDVAPVADLLERMLWLLADGEEVLRVRKSWLEHETDFEKVRVALAMSETFPYDSREEMTAQFTSLTRRWPTLKSTCDAMLETWDVQHARRR